ncbi:patatin-like phospholipase domain-containing protein 2 isoform X2 [Betta splendens]|uniref:Patatin-like phospholipase domain-containing protein 2 isoform X2 n=1 Tax=Betta splendens TaxID=158456 RepID=A0A6P7MSY4_BETSP|nr:patatin-like phospholipase domain-containing protein 2 isoform X2 [Betta splendens]
MRHWPEANQQLGLGPAAGTMWDWDQRLGPAAGTMWDWDQPWNLSFAGCGFRSMYHVGAVSCILERVPRLVHGAARIGGASSGCLVAAALVVGIPIERLCAAVLRAAQEARGHALGVFHPSFSLLRLLRAELLQQLPADAHLLASGRLCVSLTRLADGQNLLVSQFESREELVQVLMCSCFFPVYCGFLPPSYRGVRNTITVAPFSGESDICPREGAFNLLETHYGNVSIQVNTGNVHRVCTSFLPPRLETLADICHNGHVDALRFLRERGLLGAERPSSALMQTEPVCCDLRYRWLKPRGPESLPAGIQQILCRACRDGRHGDSLASRLTLLPVKVCWCLLSILWLPLQLILLLIRGTSCRQTRSSGRKDPKRCE